MSDHGSRIPDKNSKKNFLNRHSVLFASKISNNENSINNTIASTQLLFSEIFNEALNKQDEKMYFDIEKNREGGWF